MALVQFGGGVAQIRGRLGGSIFSRNRGGSYVKNFATPTNPNTAAQQAVRNAISTLVVSWLTVLTQLQRDAWETYAENVPMQNGLGDTIFLTGQQMFLRSNSVLVRNGLARVDDAPTIFNLGDFSTVTLTVSAATSPDISVDFDDTDVWANEDGGFLFVQAAKQVNPSVNFFKGPFLQAGIVIGATALPPTTPQVITTIFSYAEGNRTHARVRAMHADGRLTSVNIATAVVTA